MTYPWAYANPDKGPDRFLKIRRIIRSSVVPHLTCDLLEEPMLEVDEKTDNVEKLQLGIEVFADKC